ncbi:DJ-1/PfpI family protein [Peribacillus acanthi]|uniref:DJ-1/PfpI family protein n=1 Tax=Peribacillus acanthi TaxID=2171554 RepID=UPI000D3E3DFF|nr:DJ-1/PfpI family protein [Peribacillus acanthi]
MKVHMYVYNGFAQFESVILGYLLNTNKHEVITVGPTNGHVISAEGFKVVVDYTISEIHAKDVETLIIPGGDSYGAMGNEELKKLITELNKENKVMGGICHGPMLLAEAGILEGRTYTSNVEVHEPQFQLFKGTHLNQDVVVDQNIITATGNGYVEFAFKVAEKLEIFNKKETLEAYYSFFKNAKEPVTLG